MSSTGFAASLPQSIAFEFQEHGKFTGIIERKRGTLVPKQLDRFKGMR